MTLGRERQRTFSHPLLEHTHRRPFPENSFISVIFPSRFAGRTNTEEHGHCLPNKEKPKNSNGGKQGARPSNSFGRSQPCPQTLPEDSWYRETPS
ncbi:hypothetical protein CDAR_383471 [Caerostris darwini]|uniref:Uncharacterized protein n=1 Tax=Caerostris darwini TaxID=1538125 RepID=A0AAV4NVJ3_9ARAC|nr:hypothetical protein CDAR_383471 [Caerostris darwini]